MAYQLALSSRSGNPPTKRKGGREKGARKTGKRELGALKCKRELWACFHVYMANRMRNATIRQNRPIASDKAKPRMA